MEILTSYENFVIELDDRLRELSISQENVRFVLTDKTYSMNILATYDLGNMNWVIDSNELTEANVMHVLKGDRKIFARLCYDEFLKKARAQYFVYYNDSDDRGTNSRRVLKQVAYHYFFGLEN